MPPRSRVNARDIAASAWHASGYFLALEFASPDRPWPSSGSQEQWTAMVGPLRGIDDDQAAYLAAERRALDGQWPVTALAWLYRWCGRLGGALAVAGLAVGALTRAGRRHGPVTLAAAAMLAAALARIMFVALIDASAYPAAKSGVYLLPGVGFYGQFVLLGTWVLVSVVRNRVPRPGGPAPAARAAAGVPPESPAQPNAVATAGSGTRSPSSRSPA